jgi:mannose-6-phosphate isomerase-like protein (cupin superfamily)
MIERVLDGLAAHADAILRGDYTTLRQPPFAGFALHVSPNGSTVIALEPLATTRDALPPSHRCIDLFVLEPHAQLGRHWHRHASAHIHMLRGHGVVEVDGDAIAAAPGDQALFPAGTVHNVIAGAETVLFASFQDVPIIQPDGALDYFAATTQAGGLPART